VPSFAEGLEDLPLDEVRRRRDEALAERDYQSFLRRLIQARQDFLHAERRRRDEGAPARPIEERVKSVLSSGPMGGSRGEALRIGLPEDDIDAAERRLGDALGDTLLQEPSSMSDEELDRSLALAEAAERDVSDERVAVFRVHDRLQEELRRRYERDPNQIPDRR